MNDERILRVLENIERRLEPPASYSFNVKGRSADISNNFNPPLYFNSHKKVEIGLKQLATYYAFPNINSSNNLLKWSGTNGISPNPSQPELAWVYTFIPPGCYELARINQVIQAEVQRSGFPPDTNGVYGINIIADTAQLKASITLGNNFKIDFAGSTIRSVLGFNAKKSDGTDNVISVGTTMGENLVNILTMNAIYVRTNLSTGNSYSDNGSSITQSNYIYSFTPSVGPGYQIIEKPTEIVWYPLTLKELNYVQFYLTDQDGNKLVNGPSSTQQENLIIDCEIREI